MLKKIELILLKIIIKLDNNHIINLSDESKIKITYKRYLGKKLNLNTPKTFNEKVQWLKLNDRKDIYTKMADKITAKDYAANIIGNDYIIPTIKIYNKPDEIDFDSLPNQFVIKCNHDSGGIIICRDKSMLNIEKTRKKLEKMLRRNFYKHYREWGYKNIKPKIIIEKYMENIGDKNLKDYKFFCFNGKPEVLYVSDGSHTKHQTIAFFDMNYKQLDIKRTDYEDFDKLPNKPINFEKMKEFATILSSDIPHLRVDFYEINGHLYFGEFTFSTCAGLIPFESEKWDYKLGNMLVLPNNKN